LRGLAQESLFIREGIIGQGNWGVGKQASNQFYVYTDYGQLCDNLTRQFYPVFSYGLGAQFTTPSGQIQMDYGWSKFDQTPIEYRNGIFNLSYQVYF
jgi:outer membrane protein assembly factor BamA